MKLGYIAIDQYGDTFHIGDNPPRKWLLKHLDRSHADIMYCDTKSGEAKRVGYVIACLWLSVFAVHEWEAESC